MGLRIIKGGEKSVEDNFEGLKIVGFLMIHRIKIYKGENILLSKTAEV